MEILLIAACAWLAYTAGAQSEQSKLGMLPAQRDQMREQTRHEKAVQKIAEKHGGSAPQGATPAVAPNASVPQTFGSGYRSSRPARPPLGHRAGGWAGSGVTWAQNTGRDAWQKHRKRRKDAGHDDPGPVLVALPPETHIPADPATPGPAVDGKAKTTKPAGDGAPTAKPDRGSAPDATADTKPAKELAKPDTAEAPPKTAEAKGEKPEPVVAEAAPERPAAVDTTEPTAPTVDARQGVGRMASEVTYESVMDESDELSIMCDDDARICERIYVRAEREIGRGDTLGAEMQASGWGSKILGWLARCKESYGVIRSEVLALQHNTIAQGEAVVMAKSYLQAGQGVYAGIARDMESVLDRQAYISDAVDAEDTSAHTEIYETKAAV